VGCGPATDVVAAFRREVRLLSALRHEHIVLFRGACVDLPHLCIVPGVRKGGGTARPLPPPPPFGPRRTVFGSSLAPGHPIPEAPGFNSTHGL